MAVASPWVYVVNHEYNLKVNAKGTSISAKLWDTMLPEPADYDLVHKAPTATGRSIGLYTYGLPLSIFKDVRVSVP